MENIMNGKQYIEKSDVALPVSDWSHVCVIAESGWIFEGKRAVDKETAAGVRLVEAHVVREWSNGLGIGGLKDPEHKDEYTLDELGDLMIPVGKIIAMIPLEW